MLKILQNFPLKIPNFLKECPYVCQVEQDDENGVSELRLRLTSLEDSGEYQCSTAQYYDYEAATTTINLRVEDTVAVIQGDTRHRYIPRGKM